MDAVNGNNCIKPEEVPAKDARLRILRMLQLLQNESDVDHPMTTKMITERMDALYGQYVHRTTVPGDLSALSAAGYDIQSRRGRVWHFHYEDRMFSLAELKLLVDAVQASKFITKAKSLELIRKLSALTSRNHAENLRRSVQIAGRAKTDNEKGYYIVDVVNQAINSGRKISFQYFMYDAAMERQLKNDGRPYTVSPYDLVWDGDCYYLTGFCDERDEVRIFRADRIAHPPELLKAPARPKPEGYSPEHYTSESFRMFAADEAVPVRLRCEARVMNSFIDHFGLEAETTPQEDGSFLASVRICVSPLFYRWVFSNGGDVKILSPASVRDGYLSMLRQAIEKADTI